jgi:hypothetical protein
MRRSAVALLLGLLLVASACGDDDESSSSESSPSEDSSSEDLPAAGAGTDGSAVIQISGSTYEMTDANSCQLFGDGTVLVGFTNADDMMSLNSAGGVVHVRLNIDGADWVDTGSPPDPEISGNTATWTGDMSLFDGGGEAEVATITITC